ncbi:MAG: hypothetical protein ACJ8G7_18715 [Rhizobacter sp.]
MDRLTGSAALAAVLLTLALAGCGGGGGGADAAPSAGAPDASIQGVTTPTSVSVVTAKNAQ